jgi:hypothetical protein
VGVHSRSQSPLPPLLSSRPCWLGAWAVRRLDPVVIATALRFARLVPFRRSAPKAARCVEAVCGSSGRKAVVWLRWMDGNEMAAQVEDFLFETVSCSLAQRSGGYGGVSITCRLY